MASYGTLCTEFYDLDKPVAPAEALEYYLGRARDAKGGILEPMCGSGRFLLPMLRAGLPIEGTDASRAMLQACRARARREGLHPVLYEQPLERLRLPLKYSMAFIPSGSINLIPDSDDFRSALLRLREHLHPGGLLLLEFVDIGDDDDCDAPMEARVVHCPDGATITYTCDVSRTRAPQPLEFVGTYEKRHEGRLVARELETIVLHQRPPDDVLSCLADCGFGEPSVIQSARLPWLAASGCFLIEARADG